MTTQKVTLVLDQGAADGTYVTDGLAVIAPSQGIPDPADQINIGALPSVSVDFSTGTDGNPPQVELFPNDLIGPQQPDGTPGWTYTVSFSRIAGGSPAPWSFYLLSTNGSPQRLSSLAQVPAAQPGAQYLPNPSGAPASGQVPAVVTTDGGWYLDWQPNGTGADKNFTLPFNVASTVSVPHNLGKYPAVTVIDSAGGEVEGDVDYTDPNNLVVSFSAPFSGTVTCN